MTVPKMSQLLRPLLHAHQATISHSGHRLKQLSVKVLQHILFESVNNFYKSLSLGSQTFTKHADAKF